MIDIDCIRMLCKLRIRMVVEFYTMGQLHGMILKSTVYTYGPYYTIHSNLAIVYSHCKYQKYWQFTYLATFGLLFVALFIYPHFFLLH